MKEIVLNRKIDSELDKWNISLMRKPLLVLGARQVGKTYTVNNFAVKNYANRFIYMNFMQNTDYKEILKDKTDPKEIIESVSIYHKIKIDKDWLIIFDEIQEIPSIRTAFKLFNENYNDYHIIGLGSYLSNHLHNDKTGFPVGKVDMLNMYPLDFEEYLTSTNQEIFYENLVNKKIDNHIHKLLIEELKNYMIIGGMPEVVINYLKTNDIITTNKIKQAIHTGYIYDITKYIDGAANKLKASTIFENINVFLMQEKKSFTLSRIDKNARYRDYEDAFITLLKTNLIIKLNNLNNGSSTLRLNQKDTNYKIYFNDIGFISMLASINKQLLWNDSTNKIMGLIKGAIGENYVNQQLFAKIDYSNVGFYSFSVDGRQYEIDLMLEDTHANVIPIEIKLSENFTKKSLEKYIALNKPKYAIIISLKKFAIHLDKNGYTTILDIPLYMVPTLKFEMNRLQIDELLKSL